MRILTVIGAALFIIGGCGLDSESMLIPAIMTLSGALIVDFCVERSNYE